jgi:K+/H+ antiporter YhaU regulatory subunit KhtT
MLRGTPLDRAGHEELRRVLELTATRTHYLGETDFACGRTIGKTELRAKTGVLIIAVVRAGKPTTNPAADFTLLAGDVLVLVGAHAQLESAKAVLQQGIAPE